MNFIGSHTLLYNSWYTLLCLAVLAFLPGVFALLVSLHKADIGFSITGAAFAMIGIILILFQSVDAFTQIAAADTWGSGCTECGVYPLQEAFGTSTGFKAGQIGGLLILVGILILSVVMLRGSIFSRISGILGIVTFLYALVISFVSLSGTNSDIANVVTYALLTLWAISLTPRLLKLAKTG
jgi:hypothetical protein